MEKLTALFRLGIKYLHRYRRRYGFLMAALVFGFAVVTFITSLKDGMYDSVYYSAQSHYAGDIVAVGHDSATNKINHLGVKEISAVLEAAEEAGVNPVKTVFRTIFGERGVVYFNGNAVMQKYVVGCDWDEEAHLFSMMDFSAPPEQPFEDDSIVLSEPVAHKLGAVIGDSVILEVETRRRQKNTGVFIVRGIVRDSSIFGYYKVYVSRVTLNRLLVFRDDDCSTVGFFLDNPAAAGQKRIAFHKILSEKMETGPLVYDRDEMSLETAKPWRGIRVFLYTMPVFLSEISELLGAMNIVTYFLYGMMLLIIFVSAAVTYRLILHERAKEMGVMRAIGFYGGDLRLVLWTEVVAMGLMSLLAGFFLAWFLSWAVSSVSFSWFPSFEIFMKKGKLSALYLPKTILTNVMLIFLALTAAVFFPSFRASRKHLPALLSGEPL
ncbi:MAG: FtsX-like permease family protein [Treponema sp.]|nr:FtsX-like permease family protein [Treponema sp.]